MFSWDLYKKDKLKLFVHMVYEYIVQFAVFCVFFLVFH